MQMQPISRRRVDDSGKTIIEEPLINILIRNKHRPELFNRCIDSIRVQTYRKIRTVIACDSLLAYQQAKYKGEDVFMVEPKHNRPYFWNLYCNTLKSRVNEGWFFLMDNDDYLAGPDVIEKLASHLEERNDQFGIICQFLRNGRPKPSTELMAAKRVIEGRIGGGCLVLHYSHKDVAFWDDKGPAADFRWISSVQRKVPLKFINLVVQVAGNGGMHGK